MSDPADPRVPAVQQFLRTMYACDLQAVTVAALLAVADAAQANSGFAHDGPLPRGVRNCNPGNIRRDETAWDGLLPMQTDPEFCQFKTPAWGIRALATVLLNYQRLHGLRTVRGIISRWAPPEDGNDTAAYIAAVARRMVVDPDGEIDLHSPARLFGLTRAIIAQENANFAYPESVLADGLRMALA